MTATAGANNLLGSATVGSTVTGGTGNDTITGGSGADTYLTFTDISPIDASSLAELQALAAEAMGWQPLAEGVYLHHGAPDGENVIEVVGLPDIALVGCNVLLLT